MLCMPRTVYFGWICMRHLNDQIKVLYCVLWYYNFRPSNFSSIISRCGCWQTERRLWHSVRLNFKTFWGRKDWHLYFQNYISQPIPLYLWTRFHSVESETRAKTIYERIRFCEKYVCFEIAALFPSPWMWEKEGGNFKTNMRFTETSPFLYCLSSNMFSL